MSTEAATIGEVLSGAADWIVIHGQCVGSDPREEWGAHDVLSSIPALSIDHVHTDPPYGEHVHKSVRSNKKNEAPDVAEFECRARRVVDLGFEHLTLDVAERVADQVERICKRWFSAFSDVETHEVWRKVWTDDFEYIKAGAWWRVGGAPQITGDRPASAFEVITFAHRKGRKQWNGGGRPAGYAHPDEDDKPGIYKHPIVANRLGQRGSRLHTTQKPVALCLNVIDDFTDPGDVICDPFCGSSSYGVACLKRGRRFIGIERDLKHVETSRRRLRDTVEGLVVAKQRPKQVALFGKDIA